MELRGYASDVPHWIASRSIASVSSLVQACGAKARRPGSKRPPPLAQDSKRTSGNASVSRRHSSYTPRMWRWNSSPWRSGGSETEYGSVRVRFMSHLTYEIGALARTSRSIPNR